MDNTHSEKVVKAAAEFIEFTDKYCDNHFLQDHPALFYMLEHLKAAVHGPEQLEFPFVEDLRHPLSGDTRNGIPQRVVQ